jgi:hypothetical protein
MRHIGFTGTRRGMTDEQMSAVNRVIMDCVTRWASSIAPMTAHHGDCVGADAEFHGFVARRGFHIVGHLPVDEQHRAFCRFDETREPLCRFDETREPRTHMQRNRQIVTAADVMIATPSEMVEQERGGTWATIRMTRKAGKPLAVVLPDGFVAFERWPT